MTSALMVERNKLVFREVSRLYAFNVDASRRDRAGDRMRVEVRVKLLQPLEDIVCGVLPLELLGLGGFDVSVSQETT